MPVITKRAIEAYNDLSSAVSHGPISNGAVAHAPVSRTTGPHGAVAGGFVSEGSVQAPVSGVLVSTDTVPAHVAIIMDGNGRWAKSRSLPRIAGHREGSRAVRRVVEASIRAGVSWLTIYAFSSENWRRPVGEILDLTGLLRRYLKSEIAELKQNGVRMRFIGDRTRFDPDIQRDLEAAERDTAANTTLNLTIALSYGARAEIAAAARAAAAAVRSGRLKPEDLNEEVFQGFLATVGMPDPDLIIRTSGEQRLSNFLLWQAAYAELVFMDVLWPDFGQAHFEAALLDYSRRERRFGARAG